MAGRRPAKPAVSHLPEIDAAAVQRAADDTARWQALQDGYTAERDLLNQLLGRAQMARAVRDFADVGSLLMLRRVKEDKLYQSVSGVCGTDLNGDEIADVGTWNGFLRVLGLSRSKVDEDLANLEILGEDALRRFAVIGAGYRDLRQLRKLPDDLRQRAAAARTVDELRELLEDAEATREKLTAQVTEQQAEIQAKDRLLEQKAAKIDELACALDARYTSSHEAIDAIWKQAFRAGAAINKLDHETRLLLALAASEGPLAPSRLAAAQALSWLVRQCMALAERHGLEWDLQAEIVPPWEASRGTSSPAAQDADVVAIHPRRA